MKKILFLCFIPNILFAQDSLSSYIEEYINDNKTNTQWSVKVNDMPFSLQGLELGLKTLEENIKKSSLSKEEQENIKKNFINQYIDQSVVLYKTYEELIKNPNLTVLFEEFLRQAATQVWLENELVKDPKAVEPTNEEIGVYYQNNAERLLQLGLSATQIKQYTEQELRHKKIQEWTKKQIDTLRKDVKIELNSDIKKKYRL